LFQSLVTNIILSEIIGHETREGNIIGKKAFGEYELHFKIGLCLVTLGLSTNILLKLIKVKIKLSLCLTKHHAMKTYWGVEV